jgi:hypothetical protein
MKRITFAVSAVVLVLAVAVLAQTPASAPKPTATGLLSPSTSMAAPLLTGRISVLVPSVKDELDRVWETLKNISFFDENGYTPVFPSFPEMTTFLQKAREGQLEDAEHENLLNLMEKTFDAADYAQSYRKVSDSLPIIEKVLPTFEKYNSEWGFKVFPTYTVLLTFYGVGGSYNPELGRVILYTTREGKFYRRDNPTDTIIHEMVHIGIEECVVQAYSLEHWVKERIVDRFCHDHFLMLVPDFKMQPLEDNSVDQYLNGEGAWDNLPTRIKELKSKKEAIPSP